ncbi:MAG: alkaline phosphatase family protein [Candidatus Aminicenantaceae bacterium]
MGLFTKRKKKNRVCVIGLDGVPFPLLQDLSSRSVMPRFSELISAGHLHRMKASLPEISSVSWTDFMTGTNSGTHGIFGFTDLKPGSYDLRFPNFNDVKAETLWDRLGKVKKTSIIVNQPSTYPARRIEGTLISGFVAIEMSKAVYPLSLRPRLEEIRYEIDIDTFRAREDHGLLWKELDKTLTGREKAWEMLWEEDWDYFEFVITGTDRLQHFLWEAYADPGHPDHQRFLDYYHRIDSLVRRITEAFERLTGSNEGLYLLSDHGFTAIQQEVYLNAWLEQAGYLSFSTPEPKGLEALAPGSRAFAMDPNRIYLHTSDRYPNGSVSADQKADLKRELQTTLQDLKFEGESVIQEVFDTEDIYSGPLVSSGPDLIVLGRPGFDMKGSVKKKQTFGRTVLQGMHTYDDAFFWASGEHGDDLRISQLAEIIMRHFQ